MVFKDADFSGWCSVKNFNGKTVICWRSSFHDSERENNKKKKRDEQKKMSYG